MSPLVILPEKQSHDMLKAKLLFSLKEPRDQALKTLTQWLSDGFTCTLAVVTKTWGSAPRATGSIMIIHENGHFEGSVSGGCVEGSVIAEAQNLSDSISKKLKFSVSTQEAWEVGLACGGEIEIAIFKIPHRCFDVFNKLAHAIEQREFTYLHLSYTHETHYTSTTPKHSAFELFDSKDELVLPIAPKAKLIITGAVHIAQHLSVFAQKCDYDVLIIDPRAGFTENRNFSNIKTITEWPDEYFSKFSIDENTAIVTLTHDPKIDDTARIAALNSPAFYIGSLGSKKTHQTRLSRLKGYSRTDRIHGPIGLDIKANNPSEIAIAIMAEITSVRRATQ